MVELGGALACVPRSTAMHIRAGMPLIGSCCHTCPLRWRCQTNDQRGLMAIYKKPSKKVHRGFFYLNDETVINSLSAVESGKIDEVVAKVNSAREGGFGAGIGMQGAKI